MRKRIFTGRSYAFQIIELTWKRFLIQFLAIKDSARYNIHKLSFIFNTLKSYLKPSSSTPLKKFTENFHDCSGTPVPRTKFGSWMACTSVWTKMEKIQKMLQPINKYKCISSQKFCIAYFLYPPTKCIAQYWFWWEVL